ncbi:histone-like transcription factor CBF/NF-Y [Nitzschia inconspicua]|uniref:Histone-like transcription factor CBF/NF-Y n=1 Tax=Nitzschia inconspicua TaxID=303405 RepID=A0A9K3LKR5_9STRA|nr:histone-like transcription factor CBF/NF-Y [Nitzschia inconspicua]
MASYPGHGGQDMDESLEEMWTASTRGIQEIDPGVENWKIQSLPLARIKKIMKSEEFVLQELEKDRLQKLAEEEGIDIDTEKPTIKFMISGEAPVLMSKACELLIKDLSFRAWRHTERNRRRTLQRQDLHAAVGESEVYDFLIDIVPRVTSTTTQKVHHSPPSQAVPSAMGLGGAGHTGMAQPGIPHGMMQMQSGLQTGLTVANSMPQGMVATGQEESNAGMIQVLQTHQLAQPTQQQAYQYDSKQHSASTQSHHIPQQMQQLHHEHQQVQHQNAIEGTSAMAQQPTGQSGHLPTGSAEFWHQ